MKNTLKLAFAVLLFAGLTGCNPKGGTPASGIDSTGAAAAVVDPNAPATPPNADPNAPAPDAGPQLPPTTVQFNTLTHDFGKIKEGEVVSHKFMFKNTGNMPLKIENVKPSCGCTTPDWTKEEVAAGADGFVAVEFNSAGKEGQQTKTVNVTANTPERNITLTFTGEVVKTK